MPRLRGKIVHDLYMCQSHRALNEACIQLQYLAVYLIFILYQEVNKYSMDLYHKAWQINSYLNPTRKPKLFQENKRYGSCSWTLPKMAVKCGSYVHACVTSRVSTWSKYTSRMYQWLLCIHVKVISWSKQASLRFAS